MKKMKGYGSNSSKMGYSAKGKSMDTPIGMCSTPSNPLPSASRVSSECGPGSNPDQQKANKMLQKTHSMDESLRGKSGM